MKKIAYDIVFKTFALFVIETKMTKYKNHCLHFVHDMTKRACLLSEKHGFKDVRFLDLPGI